MGAKCEKADNAAEQSDIFSSAVDFAAHGLEAETAGTACRDQHHQANKNQRFEDAWSAHELEVAIENILADADEQAEPGKDEPDLWTPGKKEENSAGIPSGDQPAMMPFQQQRDQEEEQDNTDDTERGEVERIGQQVTQNNRQGDADGINKK